MIKRIIKKLYSKLYNIVNKIIQKFKRIIVKFFNKAYSILFTKHIKCEVRELFFQHNSERDFLRYDMIVRLLAVEDYFNKNNFGFDFYKRMQANRVSKEWVDESVERFKNLIDSYQKDGYDETSEIELDNNLNLIDGSHRMALALYNEEGFISCKVRPFKLEVNYGIEWFIVNGFTQEEIMILREKYKELHSKLIVPFTCTIWPPAQAYFEEISENLSLYGRVTEVEDFELTPHNFKALTKGIYHVDDIENWKIEKKLQMMGCTESMKVRMVQLQLEEPSFRLKQTNNKTLSKQCEVIKQVIRGAYKGKVDNYFHDTILHIGDNFYQNEHIYKLFTTKLDIKSVLNSIAEFNYVITKFDVPYMPSDFPNTFPIGKDLDIICLKFDFKQLTQMLLLKLKDLNSGLSLRIVKKNKFHHLYRLELNSYLIFQIDVACELDSMSDLFIEDMIKERVFIREIPVPTIDYEYMIRSSEFLKHPNKKHHKFFLDKNRGLVNDDNISKYGGFL